MTPCGDGVATTPTSWIRAWTKWRNLENFRLRYRPEYVSYRLGANLEALVLTGMGAVNGAGNALKNSLLGNGASNVLNGYDGDDAISGAGGNNVLIGGLGADSLDGGAGTDQAQYRQSTVGLRVDLQVPGNNTGAAGDTYLSIKGSRRHLLQRHAAWQHRPERHLRAPGRRRAFRAGGRRHARRRQRRRRAAGRPRSRISSTAACVGIDRAQYNQAASGLQPTCRRP